MTTIFYLFGSSASDFFRENEGSMLNSELSEAIFKMDFATSVYDQNSHPSELLAEYDGWNDFVEIPEELYILLQQYDAAAVDVFEILKKEYLASEVVSGEFIHSAMILDAFTEEQVRKGVQMFLDWDESPETFDIEQSESNWIIKPTNH